jgi:hypothetical protein
MKTIYKYIITRNPIEMPQNAVVVHCAKQDSYHCLWAIVDTDNPVEQRQFDIIGTGWVLEDDMRHTGTFIDGVYVWHVIERLITV